MNPILNAETIQVDTHQTAFYYTLRSLMRDGSVRSSRNGKVRELRNVRISVEQAWPPHIINENRKASLPAQLAETLWILAGRNDVGWLSKYLPRAVDFSDDGETWRGGYGPRLRDYRGVDQLAHVVDLLREDSETRRAVINIYDPEIDSEDGKDIPCNNMLYFSIRDEKLDVSVTARSNDIWWGWSGINTFEWSVLQALVAELVGVKVGSITYFIANLHIYGHHWEKAEAVLNSTVEDHAALVGDRAGDPWAPEAIFDGIEEVSDLDQELDQFFAGVSDLPSCPFIELSRSVLESYRNRAVDGTMTVSELGTSTPLQTKRYGSYFMKAWEYSPKIPWKVFPPIPGRTGITGRPFDRFTKGLYDLHRIKSSGYGDSWRRRGETLGILANEARKVDRLVLGSEDDLETLEDTASDLLIYLVKHRLWLIAEYFTEEEVSTFGGAPLREPIRLVPLVVGVGENDVVAHGHGISDHPAIVGSVLRSLYQPSENQLRGSENINRVARDLDSYLDILQVQVKNDQVFRFNTVDNMIAAVLPLAYRLWKVKEGNATRRFDGYATTEEGED